MNENEDKEEEFNIPKPSFRVVVVLVMITLFLMGLGAGKMVGYREGYTYVDNWYNGYIERNCYCTNITTQQRVLDVPSDIFSLDIDFEN